MLQRDGSLDKSEKISNILENDLRSVNNFYFKSVQLLVSGAN